MAITIWASALCASIYIVAWHIGTQAAIAGAVVMTFAVLGALGIYWVLMLSKER